MEIEKNVWRPLHVEGVFMGNFFHHYDESVGNEIIYLGENVRLVKDNVKSIDEYYVIGLRSEQIGVFVPQLVIDKKPFETLYYSPFTRIVDYFVMARNCIGVFPCDGSMMEFQNERSQQPGYDSDNDDDVKFYSFHDKDYDIHFEFAIDFSLQ